MIDFHGSTGYGQAFTDAISGDWGGKPLEDLQKGWAAAQQQFPFLNADKACALGASYGGYMVNWIAGNWNEPWKCLVNHDGVFDTRSMGYVTEELWFTEWENRGTPFDNPQDYEKFNPVTVSYTHLDVYKRQAHDPAQEILVSHAPAGLGLGATLFVAGLAGDPCVSGVTACAVPFPAAHRQRGAFPVSYTHLDVYKRQGAGLLRGARRCDGGVCATCPLSARHEREAARGAQQSDAIGGAFTTGA